MAAILLNALTTGVFAQDSTKTLTFSGGVDAYYRYNFSDNYANNYTSFTNSQSSFELGMATVRADATALSGKVTAVADLGFGRRAEEFSYNDGSSAEDKNGFVTLANVKQLFVTYAPSSKVKFTFGKFGTHIGYELLDAQLNRNYSMSYMFTNGPFFNTGLKADFTLGKVGLMLGVTNYTDQSTAATSVKSVIGQISGGSSNGKIKAFLNYTGFFGSNQGMNPSEAKSLSQLDLVVTGVVSDKFNIGFNGTYQTRKYGDESFNWYGLAGYFNFDPSAAVGLTLRSEYIGDKNNFITEADNIFANTLSLNYKVGPLTLVPEVRFETAQSEIFAKKDGTGSKSTATALMAVLYKF
ncbi:MAG: outer membrane beta-barrel protein [Ferruginibacter sp.]